MSIAQAEILDESLLVRKAREGGVQAFEQLYRRHVNRIYALSLRIAGNPSVAEEMTQDAFVRAWESLDSFRGDSLFGTWLHRVAVNSALSRMRKDARESAWEAPGLDSGPESEPHSIPARQANPGLRMDLEEAVSALPAAARAVFVLHDVEGYRHDEIAVMAGIAEGTSKAHLHRARRLLRERMEP